MSKNKVEPMKPPKSEAKKRRKSVYDKEKGLLKISTNIIDETTFKNTIKKPKEIIMLSYESYIQILMILILIFHFKIQENLTSKLKNTLKLISQWINKVDVKVDEVDAILNENLTKETTFLTKSFVNFLTRYKGFIPKSLLESNNEIQRKRKLSIKSTTNLLDEDDFSSTEDDDGVDFDDDEDEDQFISESESEKRFEIGMKEYNCSIICIKIEDTFKEEKSKSISDLINVHKKIVNIIEKNTEEFNGEIVDITEKKIYVTFNTNKAITHHEEVSGKFIMKLETGLKKLNTDYFSNSLFFVEFSFGCSSGNLYSGFLGTTKNKKQRCFGNVKKISSILADYAMKKNYSICFDSSISNDIFDFEKVDVFYFPFLKENKSIYKFNEIKRELSPQDWMMNLVRNTEVNKNEVIENSWRLFEEDKNTEALNLLDQSEETKKSILYSLLKKDLTFKKLEQENKQKFQNDKFVPLTFFNSK